MPSIAVCTLGCKVNQYDTQAMLERFQAAGYDSVDFDQPADVYLINTCTVTGTGDQKSRQMIRRAHRTNPEGAIIVSGCMAQREAQKLLYPGVWLVLGTQRRGQVVELLSNAWARGKPLVAVDGLAGAEFEPLTIHHSEGKTRATLKIQEGCDRFCTYCIIPSVRGPVRSRPLEDIAQEAGRLADQGFQEIVLTGIHLSSYGKDLGGANLLDVLDALEGVEGIARVRLGSLEPSLITEDFAKALPRFAKLCPQFMLALQSGSDSVLKRMGRSYDTASYARALELLRQVHPDAAITTDILCGFPGETEGEHQQTLAFVEACGFARIHVFSYSLRQGTAAARLPGHLEVRVKQTRAQELIALGDRLAATYTRGMLGTIQPVLFERQGPLGAEGYTPHYLRVHGPGQPGEIQSVFLQEPLEDGAKGVLISG